MYKLGATELRLIKKYNHDALDNYTIEDIKKYQDDLDQLLTIINDVAKEKYDLGFEDGYETGEHVGWRDCYDLMNDEE